MKKIYRYMALMLPVLLVSCHSSGPGCTDPRANNLDLSATENDGSCTYDPVWVDPYRSWELSNQVNETSGLILWEGRLWTLNDNADTRLYGLDTATAAITGEYLLEGVENTDWEEITQDKQYIYIGDFGNNWSGNRTDLHILRVEKGSLKDGNPSIDTIWFTYSDQHDLSPEKPNQTEFDCEAFVVFSDSIYLFTKQWITGHSTLYALSKAPGNHVAQKISSYDIQGLITGATGLEKKNLIVLCGYTGLLQPFLYLLYDYDGSDFFSGHKRRVNISIPFLQIEGISTPDGLSFYLSNESYVKEPVNIPQKLHLIELHPYLEELGCRNYMMEIGGEIRTRGVNPKGNFRRIGVDRPEFGNMIPGKQLQVIISMHNRSLATSGNYRKFYEKDGIKITHSIDPATGFPRASNLLSATVLCEEFMTADALATSCMVMGLEKAKPFIESQRGVDAYFIYGEEFGAYQVWYTDGLKRYVETP